MTAAEKLRREVEAETKRIWLDEPDEVRRLRLGLIDSGAGSYGQYFSTLVFVDGEVRALGYLCYTGILKVLDDPDFDLRHVRKVARTFVPVCAEFLGYSGLGKVWEFSRRFLDVVEHEDSRERLRDLVRALALYVNRMHGWLHFYFPWGLGTQFRIKTADDVADLKTVLGKRREG
jgi:hypothetical protein